MKTSEEINGSILRFDLGLDHEQAISRILDILLDMNERIDAIESLAKRVRSNNYDP